MAAILHHAGHGPPPPRRATTRGGVHHVKRAQLHDGQVLLGVLLQPCWWWPSTWPPARAHGARSPLGLCSAPLANVAGCHLAACSPKALSKLHDYVENERVVWRQNRRQKPAHFRPRHRHEEGQGRGHFGPWARYQCAISTTRWYSTRVAV